MGTSKTLIVNSTSASPSRHCEQAHGGALSIASDSVVRGDTFPHKDKIPFHKTRSSLISFSEYVAHRYSYSPSHRDQGYRT